MILGSTLGRQDTNSMMYAEVEVIEPQQTSSFLEST